jgi:AraC-like DNA-binding protein
MSFSDYINQQRIEKVKKLLKSEDQKKYTLLAIAENAGFSSKSSFNAVFKKMTGLTPTQYKANHKN